MGVACNSARGEPGEELARWKDRNAREGIEREEIVITRYDRIRRSFERDFEHVVIVRVANDREMVAGSDEQGAVFDQRERFLDGLRPHGGAEFGPAQHLAQIAQES